MSSISLYFIILRASLQLFFVFGEPARRLFGRAAGWEAARLRIRTVQTGRIRIRPTAGRPEAVCESRCNAAWLLL